MHWKPSDDSQNWSGQSRRSQPPHGYTHLPEIRVIVLEQTFKAQRTNQCIRIVENENLSAFDWLDYLFIIFYLLFIVYYLLIIYIFIYYLFIFIHYLFIIYYYLLFIIHIRSFRGSVRLNYVNCVPENPVGLAEWFSVYNGDLLTFDDTDLDTFTTYIYRSGHSLNIFQMMVMMMMMMIMVVMIFTKYLRFIKFVI